MKEISKSPIIRSAFKHGSTVACPSGKRTLNKYRRRIEAGKATLVDDGVEDIYQSIQLAAKGNLVGDLIRRAGLGDDQALGVDINSYSDLTNAPRSLLEAENRLIDAREQFDRLPLDIKKQFGSLSAFLTAIDDGSFVKGIQDKVAAEAKAAADAAAVVAAQPVFSEAQVNALKEMFGK